MTHSVMKYRIHNDTQLRFITPSSYHPTFLFFFFNDTAPTEIYTLPLPDALPIPPQRARLDQPLSRAHQVGDVADLPGRVVHARHPLVGPLHARLLEQAQVMIVRAAGDPQEDRIRVPRLDLEAQHVAVEAQAPLDVRHPQDQMLESLEADTGRGRAHRRGSWGYSTLTVMAAHAMSVSAPGTRKPPLTGRTLTSPWGSSRRTRSTSTDTGSGTPTVTSTSIRPPRSRTSWNSGRLECRMASDTARQAAVVESAP